MRTSVLLIALTLSSATLALQPLFQKPPAPAQCGLKDIIPLTQDLTEVFRNLQNGGIIRERTLQKLGDDLVTFGNDCLKTHLQDPRPACVAQVEATEVSVKKLVEQILARDQDAQIVSDVFRVLSDIALFRVKCVE